MRSGEPNSGVDRWAVGTCARPPAWHGAKEEVGSHWQSFVRLAFLRLGLAREQVEHPGDQCVTVLWVGVGREPGRDRVCGTCDRASAIVGGGC